LTTFAIIDHRAIEVRFGNGFVFAKTTIDFSWDIYPFINPCMSVDPRVSSFFQLSMGWYRADDEEKEEEKKNNKGLTLKTIFANIHSTSSKSDSTSCSSSAVWNVDMGIRVDLSDAIQLLISSFVPYMSELVLA
jgi:hypothetical protein